MINNRHITGFFWQSVKYSAVMIVLVFALPAIEAKAQYKTSFSCSLAKTAAARLVCVNEELAKLDLRLASVLNKLISGRPSAGTRTVRKEQRRWIIKRNRCRRDAECVRVAYQKRIAELTGVAGGTPFSPLDGVLLVHKFIPGILSEKTALQLTADQIEHEQRTFERFEASVKNSRRAGNKPENPIIAYSWQQENQSGGGAAKNDIEQVFMRKQAPWSFVLGDQRYNPNLRQFVQLFMFRPETVKDRNPQFVARDLSNIFRRHLGDIAKRVPTSFSGTIALPNMRYDFNAGVFRFAGLGKDGITDGINLLPALMDKNFVGGRFLYNGWPAFKIPAVKSLKPGIYSPDENPTAFWRKIVARSAPRTALAFDRELRLSELKFSTAESERLATAIKNNPKSLSARVNFVVDGAEVTKDPRNPKFNLVLLKSRVRSVEILLGPAQIIARLPAGSFSSPDDILGAREDERIKLAVRNKLIAPTLPTMGDTVLLSAEIRELYAVRFNPQSLDDTRVEQLIRARWHYERRFLRGKRQAAWGEVFIRRDKTKPEMVPMPEGEALIAAIPVFRAWTLARARSLPDRVVTEKTIGRLKNQYYPNSGWGQRTDVSSCIRKVNVLNVNDQTAKADQQQNICNFLKALPTVPAKGISCGFRGGFNTLTWGCGISDGYFTDLGKATKETGRGASIQTDYLKLDNVISLDEKARRLIENSGGTLRIFAQVTDVKLTRESGPSLRDEANGLIDRYLLSYGQEKPRRTSSKKPVDPYLQFDLTLTKAELIDTLTRRSIARLQITPHPGFPLNLLPVNTEELPQAREMTASGRDVVGIKVGTTFEEADKLIRDAMDVGSVLFMDRKWSWNGFAKDLKPFTSGRMYISGTRDQVIIIYDEPPAAKGVVLGVVRQLLIPASVARPADIMSQLEALYGKPDVLGVGGAFIYRPEPNPYWVDKPGKPGVQRGPWGGRSMACNGAAYWNFNLEKLWRNEDGTKNITFDSTPRFSRLPYLFGNFDDLSPLCTNAVTATIDPKTYRGSNALNIWLYDLQHYQTAFLKSREAPPSQNRPTSKAPSALGDLLAGKKPATQPATIQPQAAGTEASGASGLAQRPNPPSGARIIFKRQITSGNDDVEQSNAGKMYVDSSDLELVDDPGNNGLKQIVGLRFNNIKVPRNAVVTRATLRFTSEGRPKTGPTLLRIFAIDADDTAPFSNQPNDLAQRPKSGPPVAWEPRPWTQTGAKHETPDLAKLVQKTISRPGWRTGNSVGFLIFGTGERSAYAYDGDPAAAAQLHIEYENPFAVSSSGTAAETPPASAGNFDVIGLRLGMPFDEADAVIRREIKVGKIFRANRSWSPIAQAGKIEPFSSGRLYLSGDGGEIIVLYDEPPAAENIITGLVRQVRLPKGAVPAEAVYGQLREKYGTEVLISKLMTPSPALVWFTIPGGIQPSAGLFNPACNPLKNTLFSLGKWRNDDGSEIREQTRFVQAPIPDFNVFAPVTTDITKYCGSGVAATINTSLDPNWDTLNIWLYNLNYYANNFEKSKKTLAEDSKGAEVSAGPRLKL